MIGQVLAVVVVLFLAAAAFVLAHQLACYRDEDRGRARRRRTPSTAHRRAVRRILRAAGLLEYTGRHRPDPAPIDSVDEFLTDVFGSPR